MTFSKTFDCFLSYNTRDKQAARALATALRDRGMTVWLDEERLRPGVLWQPLLDEGVRASRSIAVLVGADGIGPWESEEIRAALTLAVKDGRPVIPVLLPGAPAMPDLPLFIHGRTWVDLRLDADFGSPSALDRLIWGITGDYPETTFSNVSPKATEASGYRGAGAVEAMVWARDAYRDHASLVVSRQAITESPFNSPMPLQSQIDALPDGGSLELPARRELAGPIVLRRPLTIDGAGATLWAVSGPVMTVESPGVRLHNLRIEVTGDVTVGDDSSQCALRVTPGCQLELDNVEVRGHVEGWPEEAGEWHYPHGLHLGSLLAERDHRLGLVLQVPVPCRIRSLVAGVDIHPYALQPGRTDLTLEVEPLRDDMLLQGVLIIETAFLKRRISLTAFIRAADFKGAAPVLWQGERIWAPNPEAVPVAEPKAPTRSPPSPAMSTDAGDYRLSTMRRDQRPDSAFLESAARVSPDPPLRQRAEVEQILQGTLFAGTAKTGICQPAAGRAPWDDGSVPEREHRGVLPSHDLFAGPAQQSTQTAPESASGSNLIANPLPASRSPGRRSAIPPPLGSAFDRSTQDAPGAAADPGATVQPPADTPLAVTGATPPRRQSSVPDSVSLSFLNNHEDGDLGV